MIKKNIYGVECLKNWRLKVDNCLENNKMVLIQSML